MNTNVVLTMMLLAAAGSRDSASATGIRRTDLQRHALSVPGREVIQVRVDFDPGSEVGPHRHPGEEVIYVLAGVLEYRVGEAEPVLLRSGGTLVVPTGVRHSARNVGRGLATELATYIVDIGQPLLSPADARVRPTERETPHLGSNSKRESDMDAHRTSSPTAIGRVDISAATADATEDASIRPFRIHVPDEALAELRRRLLATRWPDKETVEDRSQGVQRHRLESLVSYWAKDYDWRVVESRLNALPQWMTTIDGVDIHFIHVRSRHPNALPVVVTHGWPGSVIEQLKIIGPLTDPTAYGGKANDAFDVVIPSLPGYGFSGRPRGTGWGPERIAGAWAELMKRLGYTHYAAQGGDWGTPISSAMALQGAPGLSGIHINLPAAVPSDVAVALGRGVAPTGLSDQERSVFGALAASAKKGNSAYFTMLTARPQTVAYGVADSPVGLAAWVLVHPGFADWDYGENPQQALSRDDVLDDITLYWLTNTAASAGRLYWENHGRSPLLAAAWKTHEIQTPVAITVFREDAYLPPEAWVRRAYPSLTYFHEVPKGGHFAAWEQPELFASELRAAFAPLRTGR